MEVCLLGRFAVQPVLRKGGKMTQETMDVYANSVSVTTSVYDVLLVFGTRTAVGVQQGQKPFVEADEKCRIRMSPQHAKSLAALLLRHVIDYERQHNLRLPIPPEMQQIWETTVRE
jgi:hypothetical protein